METKYKEVMDHVEVTPDMRARVLNNVLDEYEMSSKKKSLFSASWFKRYAPILTVFVIVVAGSTVLQTNRNNQPVLTNGYQEVQTIEALETTVGYDIEFLEGIEEQYSDISYIAYEDGLSEIIYQGTDNTIVFRKSPGEDDNSGDYSVYEEEIVITVDDIEYTFKGSDFTYALIDWMDAGYRYSMSSSTPLDQETWITLIQSLN